MEKEKVLEIEYQEVFDEVAVRIKYQNFEVLKRGEFKDEEIIVESACVPEYINLNNKLYIQGEAESADNRIFLIDKEDLKNILEKVNKINLWRIFSDEKMSLFSFAFTGYCRVSSLF